MQGRYGYVLDDRDVVLGKGRHCVVKLATSTRHAVPRKVAIKIATISTSSAREAEILFKISHENIVEIFDYFVYDESAHIVLVFAENGNLRTFVRERGRLGDVLAGKFSRQIFDAVGYLHDTAAVVHCDLKCENVLVDGREDVKITDFGQAMEIVQKSIRERSSRDVEKTSKDVDESKRRHRRNDVTSPVEIEEPILGGSPAYAAPEVLDSCAVDPRAADVWSAGVVVFYILTAYLPFGCHGNNKIREAMNRPLRWPRPLKQITKASRTFVQSALILAPDQRPKARELRDTIWTLVPSGDSVIGI